MLWMLNFATSSKPEWIGMTVGIIAIALLMAGTITLGVGKQRTRLGLALSLLAIVFGIGFLIMMIVPEKEAVHAT